MKKKEWKQYLKWILITEAVGALSGWLTREGTEVYKNTIMKPPLSPPAIVFPIVWAILFALMGISAASIYMSPPSKARTRGLKIFFVQLAFNFLWSIIFFNMQSFGFAFVWIIMLWILILWMILTFRDVDKEAAWIQIPYLIWVTFAAYLNFGVWMLNR